MDWMERLNRGLGRIRVGQGTVEVLQWAYEQHLPDNRPHRHTFFEVCLVGNHGAGDFFVQNQAHRICPGSLFVARPGVIHQIVNREHPEMELTWISFQWTPDTTKPEGEADRLLRAFADSAILTAPDENGQLAILWQALRALGSAAPGAAYELQYQALTTALILGIAQTASERDALPPTELPLSDSGELAARLAVRFIHDNLNHPLPLSEIAAQVHLSPRHFTRLFTRFTGKSPASYITHARMDRARALLLRSALPIKEVAVTVGYPDVHHFTRAFAAHYGCPPGEARRHPELGHVPIIQNPGDLV